MRDHLGRDVRGAAFGNRTAILTLTGEQLGEAFLNGFSPFCNPAIATGRFPQVSGLRVTFACNGLVPGRDGHVEDPEWMAVCRHPSCRLTASASSPTTSCLTGGDGYTIFLQGTNVLQPGDDLMQVAIDYVDANSPVGPVVEGRIVGP